MVGVDVTRFVKLFHKDFNALYSAIAGDLLTKKKDNKGILKILHTGRTLY